MPRPTRYPETAKRLQELADSRGIQSDSEFARKIGVERGTVGSWLKGRFRPSGKNLSTIAEYFKVSEAYVLALEESATADPSRVAMALVGVERAQTELTEAIRLLNEAMAESSDPPVLPDPATPTDSQPSVQPPRSRREKPSGSFGRTGTHTSQPGQSEAL